MGIITPKLLKINHLKNLRIKYAQNPKNPENKNGFSWLEEKYQQLLAAARSRINIDKMYSSFK